MRALVRALSAEACAAICRSETVEESAARARAADESGSEWEIGPDGRLRTWMSQQDTADALSITTRHLLRLEERGLPAEGHQRNCRHPWPHAGIWYIEYELHRIANGGRAPAHLSIEDAFDAHDRGEAMEAVEITIRMRRDDAFRATMEAVDREEAAAILAVRRRRGSGTPH